MSRPAGFRASVVVVDNENVNKDMDEPDIEIPVMSPRTYRNYKSLSELNPVDMEFEMVKYHEFTEEEQREIVFQGDLER